MKVSVWLLLAVILFSCGENGRLVEESEPEYLNEQHRLQFHFSPKKAWMNDPNGMVYYDGEYHLFYQYYPDSTVWGPMHWGHAISKDLVNWQHMPIALYPDELGYIFSGSIVVDTLNTSSLGTIEKPAMVAFYTYHHPELEAKAEMYQYQGMAYSLDKGRTWIKYEGNPVIPNPGFQDFRDPKVIWHTPTQMWVMVLAAGDRILFYQSADLINWQLVSEFGEKVGSHDGVWECPDLFQLTDQRTGLKKWVLIVSIGTGGPRGSATQYFVGSFDGEVFNAEQESEIKWIDWGWDNYAGVTFSGIGDRTVFLAWMSNWLYGQKVPTHPWRSAMTLPRRLSLVSTGKQFVVVSEPVNEVNKLRNKHLPVSRQVVSQQTNWDHYMVDSYGLLDIDIMTTHIGRSGSWHLSFSNYLGDSLILGYDERQKEYYVDRSKSGVGDFYDGFLAKHTVKRIGNAPMNQHRILLDVGSVEVFFEDGLYVFTDLYFPNVPYHQLSFHTPDGALAVEGSVYHLQSIWQSLQAK